LGSIVIFVLLVN